MNLVDVVNRSEHLHSLTLRRHGAFNVVVMVFEMTRTRAREGFYNTRPFANLTNSLFINFKWSENVDGTYQLSICHDHSNTYTQPTVVSSSYCNGCNRTCLFCKYLSKLCINKCSLFFRALIADEFLVDPS